MVRKLYALIGHTPNLLVSSETVLGASSSGPGTGCCSSTPG
jgi:hypothetical protein